VSGNHVAAGRASRVRFRAFTAEQVVAIREAYRAGTLYRRLALEHDVDRKTIENCVAGRTYADFGGPIRGAK
jgi:hypothetical protein